jgi:very-long-chain enoyl-CoA reductase
MTLYFKDLGPQFSWKAVFMFEYAGPLLICSILATFRKQIYKTKKPLTFNQKIGLALVVGHFIKRELETMFLHRFSNDSMPIFNLIKNSFHYWVLFGVLNMYYFLHPDYKPPKWSQSKKFMYGVAGLFVFFEFLNFMCHLTLRNLRRPGTKERGIPQGWGFQWISCANYWWEFLCWALFSIQSGHPGSLLFLVIGVIQMMIWGVDKHNRYLKDFTNYPK